MFFKQKFMTTLEGFGLCDYTSSPVCSGSGAQYELTLTYNDKSVVRLRKTYGIKPELFWLCNKDMHNTIAQQIKALLQKINAYIHTICGYSNTLFEAYAGDFSADVANVALLAELIGELDYVTHDLVQPKETAGKLIYCDNDSLFGDLRVTENHLKYVYGTNAEVTDATKNFDAVLCVNIMKYGSAPVFVTSIKTGKRTQHLCVADIQKGLSLAERIKQVMYGEYNARIE